MLVAAAVSLAAGVYQGGEGLFFGVVFAMAFGLVGVLYVKGGSTAPKARKR